jgi:outer membrane protein OmpA-like peptidoglycan-associated protein
MKKIIIASITSLALTSCATQQGTSASTGSIFSQVPNSVIGAGVGAAAGAGIGALVGGKNKGKAALIGAAAGTALGAGIGYYMDSQEQELKKTFQGTPVQVQRQGDDLNIVMPGNVTFATNSSTINSNAYASLDSVASVLIKSPETTITVTGHTDSVGSADANMLLSKNRAESVARYLVNKGVNPQRIQSVGYGAQYPIASNDNEQGRSQNRRVEIKIHPKQQ